MTPTRQGSIRLFRLAGIDLYLHWSWFLVLVYEVSYRSSTYSSKTFNVVECLALFLIVTLHEFGHALACRQVGGQANQIVLWPLGGVAYVAPPQRPGPVLWSIAAGPLVNVVLAPILLPFGLSQVMGPPGATHGVNELLGNICWINIGLLVFNLLPVYPLDGGQILRSLLWFVLGRGRSLMVASIIGFAGVGLLVLGALAFHEVWLIVISVFILLNCWGGLQQARLLAKMERLPRRAGFACPSCRTAPPIGPFWVCARCHTRFDTFVTLGTCPRCGQQFQVTSCLDCGAPHPIEQWVVAPPFANS